jgi:hypothetical protein
MNSTDIISRSSSGMWGVTWTRTFTNYRLVRLGGEAYPDMTTATFYFKSRKKAAEYIEKALSNGWTIQGSQIIKNDPDN